MKILVTGAAGFIGFHLTQTLLARGEEIVGLDNLNDYYDIALKKARLDQLIDHVAFQFIEQDIVDRLELSSLFEHVKPDVVVHLAAQAGVRYSIDNPSAYIDSNLVGFANILEECRHNQVSHLVYASSSSVYGGNTQVPFTESHRVDRPVSLYAATKQANELMAYTYSHLYKIPTTGLRFFTVYGPWGRPDMAYFKFTKAILEGQPIPVFNCGKMRRDFTYIDDIVEGICKIIDCSPKPIDCHISDEKVSLDTAYAPHNLYNIGNNQPVSLLNFIQILENHLGIEAKKKMLPMQPGDVVETYADISKLRNDTGFEPSTSLENGLGKFVHWYRSFYEGLESESNDS